MLTKPFIEQNCVIEHNGRKFESGGAVVTDDYVVAYVGKRNESGSRFLTDWHGNVIGTCWISATWPINSFLSSTMHQLYANIDGVRYTGRGMGEGMICRLRRCKGAK